MSGISSSVGPFSGINTGQLISQLLAIEARPRTLIQSRVIQLQALQAVFLDLNSRLSSLRTAAQAFRINNVVDSAAAASSNPDALTAVARAGAPTGTYSFLVDRLVSTHAMLSRGFADRASGAIGASSFTFEPIVGRLDRDANLADLNGGNGVARGRLSITDSAGRSAVVDLSRASTVSEALDAINSAAGIEVSASVRGGRFVIADAAGGTVTVADVPGFTTATSLGIAGSGTGELVGAVVHRVALTTSLLSLNDGNGVRVSTTVGASTPDFTITDRAGTVHSVDVGNVYDAVGELTGAAPTTIQGVIERIAAATGGAVTAAVSDDGSGITLIDHTGEAGDIVVAAAGSSRAAEDLGIAGTFAGTDTAVGVRVLAALNSTLARNLAGGAGLSSGEFSIQARDGSTVYSFAVRTTGSVTDLIDDIAAGTGGRVVASLDQTGTRLVLTDTTGGSGNLIVQGEGAAALGVGTDAQGVASSSVHGERLQHRYISEATLLSSLRAGRGIGVGQFEIVDSQNNSAIVDVRSDTTTVAGLIQVINSRGLAVRARINDNGDGIVLEDTAEPPGAARIRVRDTVGAVAANLRLSGEAAGVGESNRIDGSFEITVSFLEGDTLDDAVRRINQAGAPVSASVIRDGSGAAPFRLALTSRLSGAAGQFTFDSGGLDLGLSTLSHGRDARVFFGSDDPARAILLTSPTNTLDGIIEGVRIDLLRQSPDPVTLTISRDTAAVESGVQSFIDAFNALVGRIDSASAYDPETRARGPLLGDSTSRLLRNALFSTVQSRPLGVSGPFQSLAQIGIRVGSRGRLELDPQRLRAALEQDPAAVNDLLAARVQTPREPIEVAPGITVNNTGPDEFTSLGVLELVGRLADQYTDPVSGILTRQRNALDTQVRTQNDRIAVFNQRLARRQAVLERQFSAMEQAIAQLQTQQSSLGSIRSLLG